MKNNKQPHGQGTLYIPMATFMLALLNQANDRDQENSSTITMEAFMKATGPPTALVSPPFSLFIITIIIIIIIIFIKYYY